MELTADKLKELLCYDPATGIFTRATACRCAGKVAGTPDKDGYCQISIGPRSSRMLCKAHRLAWLYMTGEWPSLDIDHVNGITGDNRWSNLRLATQKLNNANSKRRKDNKSGFKGVHWYSKRKMWRAQITIDGKNVNLGYFDDPAKGHEAYMLAARHEFGEYARAL
jgi:hypothetical protein